MDRPLLEFVRKQNNIRLAGFSHGILLHVPGLQFKIVGRDVEVIDSDDGAKLAVISPVDHTMFIYTYNGKIISFHALGDGDYAVEYGEHTVTLGAKRDDGGATLRIEVSNSGETVGWFRMRG